MFHCLFTSERHSTASDQGVKESTKTATLIIRCWETLHCLHSSLTNSNLEHREHIHLDFLLYVSLHLFGFVFRQTVSLCIIDGDFSVTLSAC